MLRSEKYASQSDLKITALLCKFVLALFRHLLFHLHSYPSLFYIPLLSGQCESRNGFDKFRCC